MIIIEGVDGSGKTTLARQLVKDGTVSKVIPSPYNKAAPEDFYDNCVGLCRLYGKHYDVAIDRYLFSELVYGPLFRSKLHITWEQSKSVVNILRNSRSVVVWCCPPLETVAREIHREPQMAGVICQLETIYWSYVGMMSAFNARPVLRYDWTIPESYHALKVRLKELR